MTALLTALGSGLSAQKILEYLMRKSPKLAPKIQSALASGLSAEKVVQFFSKGQNLDKLKAEMEQAYPMENMSNPLIQAQKIRGQNLANDPASQLQRNALPILGTAGALGTGFALRHALPPILQSMGMGGQQTPPAQAGGAANPQPTMPPGNPPQTPLGQQTSQPPVNPVNPSNIAQQPQTPQAQVKPIDLGAIAQQYPGFISKIEELKKKNDAPVIVEYFRKFAPGQVTKLEKESGQKIEDIVSEYLKQNPLKAESKAKSETAPVAEAPEEANKAEDLRKFANGELTTGSEKIVKGDLANSPKGIGEVKEIRNGHAIIEVDGKKHKIKADDLNPYSEEETQRLREHARDPKHTPMTQEELKEHNAFLKSIKQRKAEEAKRRKEIGKRYEERNKDWLEEHRKKEKENRQAELESIKGKGPEELDKLMDQGILEAAKEIEEGMAEGQKYYTVTGGEWKAVGQSDVTDIDTEEYPNRPKAIGKENFLEILEKYMPIQALYQRYKMFDDKLSSDKFFKRLEKSLIDLLTPKIE